MKNSIFLKSFLSLLLMTGGVVYAMSAGACAGSSKGDDSESFVDAATYVESGVGGVLLRRAAAGRERSCDRSAFLDSTDLFWNAMENFSTQSTLMASEPDCYGGTLTVLENNGKGLGLFAWNFFSGDRKVIHAYNYKSKKCKCSFRLNEKHASYTLLGALSGNRVIVAVEREQKDSDGNFLQWIVSHWEVWNVVSQKCEAKIKTPLKQSFALKVFDLGDRLLVHATDGKVYILSIDGLIENCFEVDQLYKFIGVLPDGNVAMLLTSGVVQVFNIHTFDIVYELSEHASLMTRSAGVVSKILKDGSIALACDNVLVVYDCVNEASSVQKFADYSIISCDQLNDGKICLGVTTGQMLIVDGEKFEIVGKSMPVGGCVIDEYNTAMVVADDKVFNVATSGGLFCSPVHALRKSLSNLSLSKTMLLFRYLQHATPKEKKDLVQYVAQGKGLPAKLDHPIHYFVCAESIFEGMLMYSVSLVDDFRMLRKKQKKRRKK